jgi:hypothetical protein
MHPVHTFSSYFTQTHFNIIPRGLFAPDVTINTLYAFLISPTYLTHLIILSTLHYFQILQNVLLIRNAGLRHGLNLCFADGLPIKFTFV